MVPHLVIWLYAYYPFSSSFSYYRRGVLDPILLPSSPSRARRGKTKGPHSGYVYSIIGIAYECNLCSAGTTENEDDYSWEDDEDEATPPTATKPVQQKNEQDADLAASLTTLKANVETTDPKLLSEPQDSRRQSSEDSYDVVSSQVSTNGETKAEQATRAKEAEEDDDSDWE